MTFLEKYFSLRDKVLAQLGSGMVTIERFNNLLNLCEKIKQNNIEGDFVETGVFKGSVSVFLCKILEYEFPDKILYACDSFCGCQDPQTAPYFYENEKHTLGIFSCPLKDVQQNFANFECLDNKVHFIEGYFKDTMPLLREKIDKISLLVFDGDSYSATLEVFNNLYDKVVKGGYIVIDDYCLPCCKDAILKFIEERKLKIELKEPVTGKILEENETPCGAWFQKI